MGYSLVEKCAKLGKAARRAGRSRLSLRAGEGREVSGPELRACSNCAGDYEDPERTAWVAEDSEEAGESEVGADEGGGEEFPDSEE